MRRFIVLGFCMLAVIVAFTTFGLANESGTEMRVPMGTLVLESPSSVEPKRANVEFPHSRHFVEVACHDCHHNWDGSKPIRGCMTSGCHDSNASLSKTETKGKTMNKDDLAVHYYKKAYHSQCIGCHKTLKEKSKQIEHAMSSLVGKIPSTGPTGCIECHPK